MDVHQWQVYLANMHAVASSEVNRQDGLSRQSNQHAMLSDRGWTRLNYS